MKKNLLCLLVLTSMVLASCKQAGNDYDYDYNRPPVDDSPVAPTVNLDARSSGAIGVEFMTRFFYISRDIYYEIYRSTAETGPFVKIAIVNSSTYSNYRYLDRGTNPSIGLNASTVYYYKVKEVVVSSGKEAESVVVSKSTLVKLAAPANLQAAWSGFAGTLLLTWDEVSDSRMGAYTIYEVNGTTYRKVGTSVPWLMGPSFFHTGLASGSKHTYVVRSQEHSILNDYANITGTIDGYESENSNQASATV